MGDNNSTFKTLKKFFQNFDYFGVQFSFDYKYNKKYRTSIGGFSFFIFIITMIIFIAVNLGSFVRRENMSIIYYNLKLAHTDKISFKNYSSTLAFRLTCDSISDDDINDLITLQMRYTSSKSVDGEKIKNRTYLNYNNCKESDFYNNFNESYETLGLKNYKCVEMGDTHIVYNIYNKIGRTVSR